MLTKLRCFLVCTILLSVLTASAATLNVGPGQTYTTIQSAINAAANGDTVLVAPGTYYENIDFKGKAITVTSSGGAAATIIDGGAKPGSAVVAFRSSETRSSILSSFTIRNGGPVTFSSYAGGGIYVYNATPTILNNIITANQCDGINVYPGAALIQGNTITNTSFALDAYCSFQPAAIVLEGYILPSPTLPNPTLTNTVLGNTIEDNSSKTGDSGGAIVIWDSTSDVIVGNIIRNNASSQGAVQLYNADSIIFSQNLVYGNSLNGNVAGSGSAGLYLALTADPPHYGVIANNTFANNTTSVGIEGASQVYTDGDVSQFFFINNIVYATGTSPLVACNGPYVYLSPGPMLVENNDVFNPSGPAYDSSCGAGAGVDGNITADPLFNNAASDFHLQSGSPAIDTGNNQAVKMLAPYNINLATDLDGNPRIQDATGHGCTIDMGTYEYPGTQSVCGTSLVLTSSLNPSNYGQTVTFTAQLSSASGVPTGDVQFSDGSTILGTQVISSTGASVFSTGQLIVGSHVITATYQPTGTFPAASATLMQTVTGYPTTTTLTSSANPAPVNQPVTFTATVTSASGTPTGSVQFSEGTSILATQPLSGAGVATFTTSTLSTGIHLITATYVPTGSFAGSSATLSQNILSGYSTATTGTSSPNPSTYGQSVNFSATVTNTSGIAGTPTGSIAFKDGATILQTVPLDASGHASYSTSVLSAGTHLISFAYVPTGSFLASAYGFSQTVNGLASTTILTANPSTAMVGSPITLTATVSPTTPPGPATPTGTVTFYNGTTLLGTSALISGTATLSWSALPVGSDQITCTYSGDTIYAISNCNTAPVTITAAPTTLTLASSANPSPALTPITFSAHLASGTQPAANAAVTLTYNPTGTSQVVVPLTTDANGNAAFTVAAGFVPGSYPISVAFAATTNLQASSASLTELVTANPTTTTLVASPNPTPQTTTVTLSATVTATTGTAAPFGTVTFLDGATPLATIAVAAAAGPTSTATFTTTSLAVGTHSLTAIYAPGGTSFLASQSSSFAETITPQDFTLTAAPPSITIETLHHASMPLTLTSIGGFAASITTTCGSLPPFATCSLSNPTQLAANGTATVTLALDTSGVPDFLSSNHRANPFSRIALAAMLPFTLLGFARRRRLRQIAAVALLAVLGLTVTACANTYPDYTPPGVYTIPITSIGQSSGAGAPTSHTLNITLTVTE